MKNLGGASWKECGDSPCIALGERRVLTRSEHRSDRVRAPFAPSPKWVRTQSERSPHPVRMLPAPGAVRLRGQALHLTGLAGAACIVLGSGDSRRRKACDLGDYTRGLRVRLRRATVRAVER